MTHGCVRHVVSVSVSVFVFVFVFVSVSMSVFGLALYPSALHAHTCVQACRIFLCAL